LQVIEEEQHIRELLGEPKPKMSLSGLLRNGLERVRRRNFGRINIQFGELIYLSKFVDRYVTGR
jgi:glycerol-3-phosphate O-acyltransferase